MLKIDDNLLQEIGLSSLPAEEKRGLLTHIYETLEMRVGMRLADQMTNEQLDEFEQYFEAKDDAGAFKWLETNFPNYKEIVNEEFEKLKGEVGSTANQILAASQQNLAAHPLQPQLAQQPQPQFQQPAPQVQPYGIPDQQAQQPQYQQPAVPQAYQPAPPTPQPSWQQPPAPTGAISPEPGFQGTAAPQGQNQPQQQPQFMQQPTMMNSQPPVVPLAPVPQPQYQQPAVPQAPPYGQPAPQPPYPTQQPPAGPAPQGQ